MSSIQKWEYLQVPIDSRMGITRPSTLNGLGANGWEMVCSLKDTVFFKRPILKALEAKQ